MTSRAAEHDRAAVRDRPPAPRAPGRPWIHVLLVALWLPVAGGTADPPRAARVPVAETPWFVFHSDPDFNLYDAVLTSAAARRREQPDPLHGECFAALVQEERSAWDAAVGYYAETVAATRGFSRERFIVRSHLAGFKVDVDADDERDLALALLFLRAAEPAYRACRWPEQDAANRRWIAALEPRLAAHGEAIARRLEASYGGAWRSLPIAVDVVGTAGWAGADTIADRSHPTHVQITSTAPGYQGDAALEMVFHEASHEIVGPRNGPVAVLLRDAAAAQGVELDRNLWHGLLFVTAGEATRTVLEAAGEPDYTPFAEANQVFRGAWANLEEPLRRYWLPYLRGAASREDAVRALVRASAAPAETP